MGESTEELRRDIDRTRAGLGDTLEAIGDRVSPRRVVERRKNRMFGGLRSARERVMGVADVHGHLADAHAGADDMMDRAKEMPTMLKGQAQGNPLTAGALAFGVGFLLAAALPPSRTEEELAEGLMSSTGPLQDELRTSGHELMDHLKEPAQQALEHLKGSATDGAGAVADAAKDAVSKSREDVTDAADTVRVQAQRASDASG